MFILLHSAALPLLNEQQFYLFGQMQTSQTGGQPDTAIPSSMMSALCFHIKRKDSFLINNK